MKGTGKRVGALLAASLLTALGSGTAQAQSCSRACLEDVLNRYLAAVMRHDPANAPLGIGYRETENAAVVAAGGGLWKTLTGLGKLQRHYMDTTNSAVGYYGTAMEGDQGIIVTLRLLVEDRKVIEAEWIIGRNDTGGPNWAGVGMTSIPGAEGTPPPAGLLPKEKRVSRRALIAIANNFFDSGPAMNEKLVAGAPDWVRLENGIGTGVGPGGMGRDGAPYLGRAAAMKAGAPQGGAPGPGAQANPDVCPGICNVAARRYPIVDEEAGTVLGIVVFQRPPGNPGRRNLLSEWFRIESGKITGIYAAMHYLNPTAAAPNWAPYDGNFPLSFNVGIPVTPPAPRAAGAPPPPPPAPIQPYVPQPAPTKPSGN